MRLVHPVCVLSSLSYFLPLQCILSPSHSSLVLPPCLPPVHSPDLPSSHPPRHSSPSPRRRGRKGGNIGSGFMSWFYDKVITGKLWRGKNNNIFIFYWGLSRLLAPATRTEARQRFWRVDSQLYEMFHAPFLGGNINAPFTDKNEEHSDTTKTARMW